MPFLLAALIRSKSGAYTARKAIPKDVQEEYERLYGYRWEAKLTLPASLTPQEAKAKHGEWIAEGEARIAAIRAAQRGHRQSLTQKQAHALSGEWYRWFCGQYEDNPGEPERWDENFWLLVDRLEELAPASVLASSHKTLDWTREPEVRDGIRPVIAKEAKADQFLANKGISLTEDAYRLFIDCVLDDYIAVVLLLERRARGDFSSDERLEQFPKFDPAPRPHKDPKGFTPWTLFHAWVTARQPKVATVDRWRAVFLDLEKHFAGRTAGSITEDEAQAWAEQAVTTKRSAGVVMDVWCNAAHTVFGWAVATKKLSTNPFQNIKIAVPPKVKSREKEFRPEEARRILSASLAFTDTKRAFDAARRWVPWICAYTGARAGEITQLRGRDVVKREGHWAIQITPEAGTVKTSEARTVPLHEHLLEQGFIEFVRSKGDGPLFYNDDTPTKVANGDPTNPSKPRAVRTRERIGDWVRDIQPNHAWRHTFIRTAIRAGIQKNIRTAMCGHAFTDVSEEYETPSVADIAEALKKFPRYDTEQT